MELQKTKHQLKLDQWRGLVYECRSSGQTIKAWCSQRGICVATYYRWQKQVWDAGTGEQRMVPVSRSAATFAEYRPPASPSEGAVIIHLGWGNVEIRNGAEQTVIENTLQALKRYAE